MYFFKKSIIRRDDGAPYLIRYTLFGCKSFSIKLHKILLSDHDCVHDHPWSFISLILKGGYVEYVEKEEFYDNDNNIDYGMRLVKTSKIYHPGSILYRKADHRHKLEIHQPCTTLVITFKKTRDWGFWTKKGWVLWKKYVPTSSCE